MNHLDRTVAALSLALVGWGCSNSGTPDGVKTSRLELQANQEQKLVASDPATGDRFGNSVALSGDTALVGSSDDDVGSSVNQGSAFVLVRTGSSWTQQQKLTAPDGQAGDGFGFRVALFGDTALVGAFRDDVGTNADQGSAYVFTRTGSTWTFQQKLLAADGGRANDLFGGSVALEGNTAVVGADGSARVFVRSGSTWTEQQKLTRPDGVLINAFGLAAALSGDTIVLGSLRDTVGANADQGSAYVFVRSGSTWTLQQRLLAADGQDQDRLGNAVALSGDTALIGTDSTKVSTGRFGSAYVFVRSGSSWTQQQKLIASDRTAGDAFGLHLALLGNVALIGASLHEHLGQNADHGAAYVFLRSGSLWTEDRELRASDGQNNDRFGNLVALSGNSALIGAPNDDGAFSAQGSAYVFRFGGTNGDVCSTNDQCVTGFCADGRCCNSACNGPCDACSVLAGAALNGQCAFVAAGSPGSPACAPLSCSGTSAQCATSAQCGQCSSDANCASGTYCDPSGVCQPQKAQGRACEPVAGADCKAAGCRVCSTGQCVDGFCCNAACTEGCSSCANAFTGAANGTCAPIRADSDPKNACAAHSGFPDSCGADGECDGQGACRTFAPAGTSCGDLTCSSSSLTEFACDSSGNCLGSSQSCGSGGSGGSGTGGSGGAGGGTTGGSAGLGGSGGFGGSAGSGGSAGASGSGGTGGAPSACIRVAPDGNDAAAIASNGTTPFANIQPAIDFADTHRNVATSVCVAAGPACLELTIGIYPGPSGADLTMRSGISVLGRFETTNWTRCSGIRGRTMLVPATARGVVFGPEIDDETTLNGFGVQSFIADTSAAVTVDGARAARLVDITIAESALAVAVTRAYGIDVRSGAEATIESSRISPRQGSIESIALRSVGSRVSFQDGELAALGVGAAYAAWLEDSPGSLIQQSLLSGNGTGVHVEGDSADVVVSDNGIELRNRVDLVGIELVSCGEAQPVIAANDLVVTGPTLGNGGPGSFGILTTDCGARVLSNAIEIIATNGERGVGLECVGQCVVIDNEISTMTRKRSNLMGVGGNGVGVSCVGCTEISGNLITGLASVEGCGLNCGFYGSIGLAISGDGVLVDQNRIEGGCSGGPGGGTGSIGISASGSIRIQNNVVFGGDCQLNPFFAGMASAHGLVVRDGTFDIHSNFIDGGRPTTSVCASAGIRIAGMNAATIRNNIIAAGSCTSGVNVEEASPGNNPAALENNAFVPGINSALYRDQGTVDPTTIAQVNALADIISSDNFSAGCVLPLVSTSPCVDTGTPTGAPDHDIDGDPRNPASPDVGPDEWGDLP